MTKDMTKGSPLRLILGFAFPMLLGMLFQQFYNLVDTMIVGKTLGVSALAGVGATSSINFMIIGFCMGICSGFAIPVAQQFGAGKYSELRKYVFNGYVCSAVFAVVMTILSVVFCAPILRLLNTPDDIFMHAYNYIVIIFAGIPTVFLYNIVSGIIRSLGDSKTPVYFLVLSSVINIALDFILILYVKMGVAGAGVATVVSQLIAGVGCTIYMYKKFDILKGTKQEKVISKKHISNLCFIGVPMGLQYSITAIGSVVLQTAVNRLGSTAVAAVASGGKLAMFFCCPFDAMGSTMSTYAGQNLGAQKLDRVDKGIFACSGLALVYSVIACAALLFTGQYLALLFVDGTETRLIEMIAAFLRWNCIFYFPLALVNIVRFTIQGLGFGKLAILAGVCEMAARSIIGFYFVPVFGFTAACLASPIAWILADVFLIPAYFLVVKHLKMELCMS